MKNRIKVIVLFLGLALVASYLLLDQLVVNYGFKSAGNAIGIVAKNYLNSDRNHALTVGLAIEEKDFLHLQEKRDQAIERGLLINEEDSYVPFKFLHEKDTLVGQIRLKGHMLDHLKGNKWSYRIKLRGNDRFKGMKRFSIQHPGTRNYIYEWVFHEMLKRENIIALNYDFINLNLNGEALGIYALEENFAEELLESNGRPKGVIMRFNPNLYWARRARRDLKGYRIWEEYSRYQTSFVEPYDRPRSLSDEMLIDNFSEARKRIQQFRKGEQSTAEVFDIEKLATYHAIIDLVGGHHSLDWSDIKYFYNSITGRIEPVGYESFSASEINTLSGLYNYVVDPVSTNVFHKILFSDATFFKQYVKELERLSQVEYLNKFFTAIDSTLSLKQAVLNVEFPYKEFDPSTYYRNQELIKEYLTIPEGMHAYSMGLDSNELRLFIGAINNLPVEMVGIEIDGKYKKIDPFILPSKNMGELIRYENYIIPINKKLQSKFKPGCSIRIAWRLLGTSERNFTDVFKTSFEMPYVVNEELESFNSSINSSVKTKDFVIVKGNYLVSKPFTFTSDKNVVVLPGVQFTFRDSGKFIFNNTVEFQGTQEEPIVIDTEKVTNGNYLESHLSKSQQVRMENVINLGGQEEYQIYQNGGRFYADNCLFKNGVKFCVFENVNVIVRNTVFETFQTASIAINRCDAQLNEVSFVDCENGVIDINLSGLKIKTLSSSSDGMVISHNTGFIEGPEDDISFCELGSSVQKVELK
ncbi:CotH kinase family protein [Flavobacteriales bacterium]|nr:CotH kinase family protein [Flavobacteriales bacterium]